MLSKNPNLKKIDYIVIKTHYTNRVINSQKLLDIIEPAVVYTDKNWEPNLAPYVKDSDALKIVNELFGKKTSGNCVFNAESADEIFEKVILLGESNYCVWCRVSEICNIEWYKINKKVVAYCEVNTSSG